MKLTFLGAAGEVTGSQHLIETRSGRRILLDCGLFQGHRLEAYGKNRRFRCHPANLDAVVLSHAHIDHCGNLPGLFRAGFDGPIFCTEATADVAAIMLRDSARLQEEDIRYLKRHAPAGDVPFEPLYTEKQARAVVRQFETLDYGRWYELADDVKLCLRDAGHILGSATVELVLEDGRETRRVVFTGDLGRRGLPLLRDPWLIDGYCDVVITESTYANRVHPPADDIRTELLRILREAIEAGGKVLVPAFSLGRTQRLVYFLNDLTNSGLLPPIPVFVDSPLAVRLTEVYRRHKDLLNAGVQRVLATDEDPFGFQGLTYIGSQRESIALNNRPGPFVVISAHGMCEGGRILHHLKHSVGDPRNTIVIIGFQAAHTLGRRIVERRPYLRIFDREYPLRAKVEILNGLSAHADLHDFRWWFGHMVSTGGIGHAFVVHGEEKPAKAMMALLRDDCDHEPVAPKLYQSFEV